MVDAPQVLVDDEEVADHEGLVDDDGERCKQVAENVLNGQCHGEASHAQSRNERGDIHSEVVQGQE